MVNWCDYVMGWVDVEVWLRITIDGEYLPLDYLDSRELHEYLGYYMS